MKNDGADDAVLGFPLCPDCSLPENNGVQCGNPLFECSSVHGHQHLAGFFQAELRNTSGQVVATGNKSGFCLVDIECSPRVYNCGYQGITAGCADVYNRTLDCQYIDLTDSNISSGDYTLHVSIDSQHQIAESDETAIVFGMPKGAIGTGCVDHVLPLDGVIAALHRMVRE